MSGSHKDRVEKENDELTPEELGKVTGGSIPLKHHDPDAEEAGTPFGTDPGKQRPSKPRNDDFIKPF